MVEIKSSELPDDSTATKFRVVLCVVIGVKIFKIIFFKYTKLIYFQDFIKYSLALI